MRAILVAAALFWGALAASSQAPLTPSALRNHPAIRYQQTPPADAVALLNARLREGEAALAFDQRNGYLRAALEALDVSPTSQVLVFSKTSFQARRIGPANPRALFFNDTLAIGWVRGGEVLEVAAQDPAQGTIFYTLEQNETSSPPQFKRDLICIQCHTWEATANVPGLFLGSAFPDAAGSPLYVPVHSVDHRTPFELRWGGWFVTGRHAIPHHLGNATVAPGQPYEAMVSASTVNVDSIDRWFDSAGYPSPGSDLVALLVLEHQVHLLNLLTRLGWETRIGEASGRQLDEAVRELVDYMLFVDEHPLPGPVAATPFAADFARRGPRDRLGRSLRDLDLQTRLMRHPLSFLIYSAPFDALPDAARRAVYARLWAVLGGEETDPRYAAVVREREAIIGILRDTKPDLPVYFRSGSGTSAE
jgi:hypothetical protein